MRSYGIDRCFCGDVFLCSYATHQPQNPPAHVVNFHFVSSIYRPQVFASEEKDQHLLVLTDDGPTVLRIVLSFLPFEQDCTTRLFNAVGTSILTKAKTVRPLFGPQFNGTNLFATICRKVEMIPTRFLKNATKQQVCMFVHDKKSKCTSGHFASDCSVKENVGQQIEAPY